MGLESLVGNSNQLFPVGLDNSVGVPVSAPESNAVASISGPAKGPGGPQLIYNNNIAQPGGGLIGKPFIPPTAISGPGTITDPKLFPELFPPNFLNQVGPLQTAEPDYSSQFENFGKTLGGFGEQLGGFGEQMTGYQDALGSFNEQVGGFGKQFETINNRLDSVDKGLGSLGNQIASFENMQKAQPQGFIPQQQQSYSPFGFGGFGGLASLFGGYF